MKKLFCLLFILLVSAITRLDGQRSLPIGNTLTQGTLYNEITEGIAYRLKFWTLYRELRSAAYNQIERLIKATEKKVADLLFAYNDHQAAMVRRSLKLYIDQLSRDFDNIFEAVEYQLLYQGIVLDNHSATIEEKERFVNKQKINLQNSVNARLRESAEMISRIMA